ncbi:MAG: hypothetical protein HZC06_12320, partial [Methylocystis sp.]|nr:hypothetical protein [Methylocystis sp.]
MTALQKTTSNAGAPEIKRAEQPLLQAGLRLKHIEEDRTVPMYRTSIATE